MKPGFCFYIPAKVSNLGLTASSRLVGIGAVSVLYRPKLYSRVFHLQDGIGF
jgi:hypothetical protein